MFRITFGFCLFCLLSLCSCSLYNYTYIQTPVSVPDLAESGDLKVQGSVNPKGFYAEIAYSPIQHLGVLITATSAFDKEVKSADVGLGYYFIKKDYLFSIYGGVGFGDLVNKGESKEWFGMDTKAWDNSSNYNKLYLQASLGKNFGKFFRLSIAMRASYVMFNSYQYRYDYKNYTDEKSYYKLDEEFDTLQLSSNASALIIDPAVMATFFQSKRFTFTAQIGLCFLQKYGEFTKEHTIDLSSYKPPFSSYPTTASQSTAPYQLLISPLTFNIGARFNIHTKSKKKKTE